ncbi:hypothetical protein [uncultured Desulfovibrio sp.]|uniref:Uncharacterized protein n=1 Tax=Candidatus Desulfovibrio intestinavium TaxID=2838534 RepID=A0A9D2KNT3_9BACT|nr:hypothetical protein [uncultured Desulfovibrio sp.]HJA78012.1 hypothetical protein [Candidatus Desulfovibrio intestinavium]
MLLAPHCAYCGSRRTILSDSPHISPWKKLFAVLHRLSAQPPARGLHFVICKDCRKISLLQFARTPCARGQQ